MVFQPSNAPQPWEPEKTLLMKLGNVQRVAALSLTALVLVPRDLPAAQANSYVQTDLVSDVGGLAKNQDVNLVNPWGIALSATSPLWVANNGTGVSSLYNGAGDIQSLVVSVPPASGVNPPSTPTGIVFNGGAGFEVEPGRPSRFIFATEGGTISGWNPAAAPTSGLLKVDNSASGAIYTGLAMANTGSGDLLYAANFHAGTIDVFDSMFSATALGGAFTDPNLPSGYAPFNVQNLGGQLYVTYALQDAQGMDRLVGPGTGFVDVFDPSGNLLHRLISSGPLNAPWGLALAGPDFGAFGNALLVGNFGDGRINAFDPTSGYLLGTLQDSQGNAIEIDGLWGLTFGNGGNGGDKNDLYFTAGIQHETHGLFGEIAASSAPDAANTGVLLGLATLGLVGLASRRRPQSSRPSAA
jgi:uncharacterized protein (TIGR03118 family)